MKKVIYPLLFSALTLPLSAIAEIDKTVVAKVNGKPVIAQELIMTAEQNKIDYATLNTQQKKMLLNGLVNRILVANEAKNAKLDKDPEIELRLNALVDSVLAATMLENKTAQTEVSDEEIKKYYDEKIKSDIQKQYKARHILVKEEATAQDILKSVRDGKNFSSLAMEKSIDKGSAIKGGDLGWFNPATMVPEFANAVKKATKGEVTAPVKSQFGWHLIIVDDSKTIDPPSLKDSSEKIKQLLVKEKISRYLESLKKEYKIEVLLD